MIHQIPLAFMATFGIAGTMLGTVQPLTPMYQYWVCGALLVLLSVCIAKGNASWGWLLTAMLCLPVFASRYAKVTADYQSAPILRIAKETPEPAIMRVVMDQPIVLRRNPLAELAGRSGISPWQTQFQASVIENRIGRTFEPCRGRVLIVAPGKLDGFRPGDHLEVYGSLRSFPPPTNPGQRDLRAVYQRRNLHARVDVDSADQIVVLSQSRPSPIRWIAWLANASRDSLMQHTSESTGPLAIALVIGQRDFVDSDTRDLLLVTGTAHLLSVSGMHLAIIVMLAKLVSMFFRFAPTTEMVWIIGVCAVYVAITGGRPPVMRAAMLIAALMIATWLHRPSHPINTLSLAALILVFVNPLNVMAVGVQLSFLAVATLMLCSRQVRMPSTSPAIDQALEKEEQLRQLSDNSRSWIVRYGRVGVVAVRQMVWLSACVTATSLPLVWYHFHVVSPVSVVTNVLLSPLLVVALATGVGTALFGLISSTIAGIFGAMCSVFLEIMLQIIQFASSIPAGHFWLPSPHPAWVGVFYAVLAGSLYWRGNRRVVWMRRTWILPWCLVAWWSATTPASLPEGTIEATFVDVGHGTSVVLRLNENEVWLYDCGRLANAVGSSRNIDDTLWSMGVTQLEGVFLSHADSDHYNALPGILKRFSVKQIITPPGMLDEDEHGALDATRKAISDAQIPVREVHLGDHIQVAPSPSSLQRTKRQPKQGSTAMDVLHPPLGGVGGNDNANSMVLCISHGGHVLLLPGDLEPPGTAALINQPRLRPGGVLMAPHHGSLSMNADAVLQWARPRETIVSGGRRAGRVEVAQMLAATGSGVHVTSLMGSVRVRIDRNGKIEIRGWRDQSW